MSETIMVRGVSPVENSSRKLLSPIDVFLEQQVVIEEVQDEASEQNNAEISK